MIKKYKYLATCLKKRVLGQGSACPSCGASGSQHVARKFFVTELVRCNSCRLMFRVPTTNSQENEAFYQRTYSQGFTSEMPDTDSLAHLVRSGFVGSEKDYTTYLKVLKALGGQPGMRVFDFGCSWGYGSWQLRQAGYDVVAYEISKPRCAYARQKLEVQAFDELKEVPEGQFDIFFSAHVIEHVPSVKDSIALARRLVRAGGLIVSFTPNGSYAFQKKDPWQWQRLWGMVHPNFLDDQFYEANLTNVLVASDPYDLSKLSEWSSTGKLVSRHSLDGIELLSAARVLPE